MGFAKRVWEQEQSQGWSFTDQLVCSKCVVEDALKAVVASDEESDNTCDFCGRSPAAPLDTLLEGFVNGLRNVYGNADDVGVPYSSAEGGYVGAATWDTHDLIEMYYDVFGHEDLPEAVAAAIELSMWAEQDFIADHMDEALLDAWNRFCEQVQHRTRYVFHHERRHSDGFNDLYAGEISPSRILVEIGRYLDQVGVIREIPAGTKFWRATMHGEPIDLTAARLGTAPRKYAKQANRMSPAGIPMFYGADSLETAVKEVVVRSTEIHVTAAQFATTHPCVVADFTSLIPAPSQFDPELGRLFRVVPFLRKFRDRLSQPARETYEQIDYVPTQIVTEYLLQVYEGADVVGLVYDSALTGDRCIVLDVPNDRCIEPQSAGDKLALVIDRDSMTTRSVTPDEKAS